MKLTYKLVIIGFLIELFFVVPISWAQSSSLEDVADYISQDNRDATGVEHTVSFKLPASALSIDFTDYIQINLTDFDDVTAVTSITGQYSGTPVFTLSGSTARVTGIFVLPGKTLTFNGITATNPTSGESYDLVVSVTTNEAGTIIKNYGVTTATTNPGTVTVSADVTVPQATIRITGYTAPETYVSFIEGENVIGTDVAGSLGIFNKVFSAMDPGDHEISLYGVDGSSRGTSIIPLTITAPAYQTTTISNLLLSPAFEISATEVNQGSPLYATGSAYPGSAVTIFTDTPLRTYTATASSVGAWTTTISDTADYLPGDYRLYTLAQDGGLQSLTSRTIVFSIVDSESSASGTACGDISQGDLDCDSSIDLTDFSILMYYWATANATADINSDGSVNLTDFSILMYYWGT